MKKFIFIPLMVLTIFPSCNKSTCYTVNAREMLDAFDLSDEKYLQTMTQYNDREDHKLYNEISPTVFYHLNYLHYDEYFVTKNGNEYRKYVRDNPKGSFSDEPATEDEFATPEKMAESLLKPILDCKYEDFVYNKESHEYTVAFTYKEGKFHSAITFVNKKVDHVVNWFDEEGRESDNTPTFYFSYKKYTPIYPPKK